MTRALALPLRLASVELALALSASAAPVSTVFLEDLTWTELIERIHSGMTKIILPIGSMEQSGPAMALGKHDVWVRLLSERIARELGNALVAPVLAYVPEGAVSPPFEEFISPNVRFGSIVLKNSPSAGRWPGW